MKCNCTFQKNLFCIGKSEQERMNTLHWFPLIANHVVLMYINFHVLVFHNNRKLSQFSEQLIRFSYNGCTFDSNQIGLTGIIADPINITIRLTFSLVSSPTNELLLNNHLYSKGFSHTSRALKYHQNKLLLNGMQSCMKQISFELEASYEL